MAIRTIIGDKASNMFFKLSSNSQKKVEIIASDFGNTITYPMVYKVYIEERFSENESTKNKQDKCSMIRIKCKELACLLVDNVPDSRELSTALTNLESAMFFAEAGIQRNYEVVND